MIRTILPLNTAFTLLLLLAFEVTAQPDKTLNDIEIVQELHYLEREPGVDDHKIKMLVSDRFIRIDETGDDSGFIIFDNELKIIFSVSHYDESVLIIKEQEFTIKNSPAKVNVEYLQLSDAPTVSGKQVFNYRVYAGEGDAEVTCMEVQLAENLLPDIRVLLQNYQVVISGQQVKMTDNKITDTQTACYFADQIYNTGAYFDKGLPIQEWHSNERSKILTAYKKVTVERKIFRVPENYRQFSIDMDSKTFIN